MENRGSRLCRLDCALDDLGRSHRKIFRHGGSMHRPGHSARNDDLAIVPVFHLVAMRAARPPQFNCASLPLRCGKGFDCGRPRAEIEEPDLFGNLHDVFERLRNPSTTILTQTPTNVRQNSPWASRRMRSTDSMSDRFSSSAAHATVDVLHRTSSFQGGSAASGACDNASLSVVRSCSLCGSNCNAW